MDNEHKDSVTDKLLWILAYPVAFFASLFKRLKRRRRLKTMIRQVVTLTFGFAIVAASVWGMHTYIYGIYESDIQIMAYLDDVPLGLVENMYVLNDAKLLLEDYDYNLTYKFVTTNDKTFLSNIDCYNILNNLNPNGLTKSFVLYIDDTEIAAAKDDTEIQNALDQILNEHKNSNDGNVKFYNNIKIAELNYVKTELKDYDYFYNYLSELNLKFITYKQEKFTEVDKYTVEYRNSDRYYTGLSVQINEGYDGIIEYVYELGYLDGEIYSKNLISQSMLIETQPTVILKGSKIPPPAEPTGKFLWPVEFHEKTYITSEFGLQREPYDGEEFHFGIDIIGSIGEIVYASDGGVVIFSGRTYSYGNNIKIQHGEYMVTYYAHLSEIFVEVDEKVYPGQAIGKIGNTGVSTGSHLHFEIRYGGSPVDPRDYLPPQPK